MVMPLEKPGVEDLEDLVFHLGQWQRSGGPVQLHPGDLGWASLRGADTLASRLRVWRRGRQPVALGLLDGPSLIRMGISPEADDSAELAEQLVTDLSTATRDSLLRSVDVIEARSGSAFRALLQDQGWKRDDPWVPLRLDLAEEPEDVSAQVGLSVEAVDATTAHEWFAVHVAAFNGRGDAHWEPLSQSVPFRQGLCLLGRDENGSAAACIAVWSAGVGRPGLIEPLGVHPDHRRRGFGRAMNLAAARAVRALGASELVVATPRTQAGAVESYLAAGFTAEPDELDFLRP